MAQENIWDREYKNSKLLTKDNKPQSDVVRFVKFLKSKNLGLEDKKVLDLGSGAGRNSFYFAELGATAIGFEISREAISIAEKNAKEAGLNIIYKKQSIGEEFPVENEYFDIILDITSSNSLTESEREVYLKESKRVLKSNGYFFVKALCKDSDENAKKLLLKFPGKEKDTYIMPELGLSERVWTKEDFVETYQKYFDILFIEKKTSYSRMNNRVYKRNFWICYMKK